jgi:hypothetical protein
MMARSTTRSKQRPDTLMQDRTCRIEETSCNARPDHTFGLIATVLADQKFRYCPRCTGSGSDVSRYTRFAMLASPLDLRRPKQ